MSRLQHLAIAVLLLSSLSAHAQELSFSAFAAGHGLQDDGYFLLSDDNQSVRANLSLGFEVFENLSVFAEYDTGTEHGALFEDLTMTFTVNAACVGLVYRYPLLEWLHPYALAGVGACWGDIDLEAPAQTYDATDFGMGGFVLGGIEAVWYIGGREPTADASFIQRLGLGVANDYGYSFGPSLDFDDLRPDSGGGTPVDLGEVDLSGFTWRVGLTIRYLL